MKKKIWIPLGIVGIIVLILGIFFVVRTVKGSAFIKVEPHDNNMIPEETIVFTDYDSYQELFHSKELTEKDFENNNYVLVRAKDDSCGESDLKPVDYTIGKEKIDVTVTYKSCGDCSSQYLYFLLKVDKSITTTTVNITYRDLPNPECSTSPGVYYKPILYVYPTETTEVTVRLENEQVLTTTYPKYQNEWKVIAEPSGILHDEKTGRELYGLYWEGKDHKATVQKDGFVVKGEDTISFLEEKLKILGLTEREADEFIIYWLPKLEKNKYNYVRFETMEEINAYMPLHIMPKPDTIIRVLMDYKPLDKKISVAKQQLPSLKRTGFTVVEWGGSLIA